MDGTPDVFRVTGTRLVRPRTSRRSTIRCTAMDRALGPLSISIALFYPKAIDENPLVEALTKALTTVPIFAGRLRKGKELEISVDDSGVPFSAGDAALNQFDAMAAASRGEAPWLVELIDPGVPDCPVLTVRLTRLADGSAVIGCCWHHSVGDMHSFMLFMRAWCDWTNGQPVTTPHVVEDRIAFLEAQLPSTGGVDLPEYELLGWPEFARLAGAAIWYGGRSKQIQIFFSDEELGRMREAFGEPAGTRLTTNDVVCAHLLRTIWDRDPSVPDRRLWLTVNFRRRYGLDDTLFGNLFAAVPIACRSAQTAPEIARSIRSVVGDFPREFRLRIAPTSAGPTTELIRRLPRGIEPLKRSLFVTSWCNFGVFDCVLFDQTPTFFTPVAHPTRKAPPWISMINEGFANSGVLVTGSFTPYVAGRLSADECRQELHRFRASDDPTSPLTERNPSIL